MRGSPAGPVTRLSTSSRKSLPVTASMISANTQWADVAWYSKRVPGSQLRRHPAIFCLRDVRSLQAGGPIGAYGNPEVCNITCSTVMASLPLSPNSGKYVVTGSAMSTSPSVIRVQTVEATYGFVAEKIT